MAAASAYRASTTSRVLAGAVYLHVLVVWHTPAIPAVAIGRGPLRLDEDFLGAYRAAPEALQQAGIPALVRGKPRPVVVLRLGSDEDDPAHRDTAWVAPRYGRHERSRAGRNLFPMPADRAFGLTDEGYLDFFQLATVPLALLGQGRRVCDVTPETYRAIVAALRSFLDPW